MKVTAFVGSVQKPGSLTTSDWSIYANYIYLTINDLTLAKDGQFVPAKGGQGHWLFHYSPQTSLC